MPDYPDLRKGTMHQLVKRDVLQERKREKRWKLHEYTTTLPGRTDPKTTRSLACNAHVRKVIIERHQSLFRPSHSPSQRLALRRQSLLF